MDDFLYIILGIAWLGWSLYSNKQKMDKKRAEQAEQQRRAQMEASESDERPYIPPPAYEPAPQRSILDELFGDQMPTHPEAEEETYIPDVDEQSWEKKMKEYRKVEAESQEEIREEVSSDYFTRQYAERNIAEGQRVINDRPDYEEVETAEELQEEFDLKKAVIYSEVLRAPYVP